MSEWNSDIDAIGWGHYVRLRLKNGTELNAFCAWGGSLYSAKNLKRIDDAVAWRAV